MKILVVGSGGREHAIVWAIDRSLRKTTIFCAPGNAGISRYAECISIGANKIVRLADFAAKEKIDLTFVGGEEPLALGIVDEFERRGLRIIGASQKAARLESSKTFAKEFMARHDIPSSRYKIANSADEAIEILNSGFFGDESVPVVVKADGLAAGKGVIVAADRASAVEATKSLTSGENIDPESAKSIVLEECVFGKEISLLFFCDGKDFIAMPPVRDHKRVGEGDIGLNTGGMGAICDSSFLSEVDQKNILDEIVKPTLAGASAEGFPFKGILFLGLMLTTSGTKVLEYNVRFGDPETQAILANLESDFLDICNGICDQTLGNLSVVWREGISTCVIMASHNYPQKPRMMDKISGLDDTTSHENVVVFHSGTARNKGGEYVTAGGRVLGITAIASNLSNSRHRAYKAVNEIGWDGVHFRRDIGRTR